MLSNSQIKLIKSLHTKKFRVAENQFIIEGHRLIEEAFRAKTKFDGIWCSEEYAKKNGEFLIALKRAGNKWESTSAKSLSQVCDSQQNQGIIALLPLPEQTEFKSDNSPILLFDNISDPGNMGTLLRTAEWFGLKNVILSPKCVDIYNSKVVRSAMGAHFYLNQNCTREYTPNYSPTSKRGLYYYWCRHGWNLNRKIFNPSKMGIGIGQ